MLIIYLLEMRPRYLTAVSCTLVHNLEGFIVHKWLLLFFIVELILSIDRCTKFMYQNQSGNKMVLEHL